MRAVVAGPEVIGDILPPIGGVPITFYPFAMRSLGPVDVVIDTIGAFGGSRGGITAPPDPDLLGPGEPGQGVALLPPGGLGTGLPDGTKATLRYLEPEREQGGTQGPYWEGKFDRCRTTYTLTITSEDITEYEARRALSTMVEVSQKQVAGGEIRTEEELVHAVENYYEAVDRED